VCPLVHLIDASDIDCCYQFNRALDSLVRIVELMVERFCHGVQPASTSLVVGGGGGGGGGPMSSSAESNSSLGSTDGADSPNASRSTSDSEGNSSATSAATVHVAPESPAPPRNALADDYLAAEIECTKSLQSLAQHLLPVCRCCQRELRRRCLTTLAHAPTHRAVVIGTARAHVAVGVVALDARYARAGRSLAPRAHSLAHSLTHSPHTRPKLRRVPRALR